MKRTQILFSFVFLMIAFSGCDLIEGVFKGGVIIGIIIAAIIIGLIAWLSFEAFRKPV
ncbi:MAG: hypothetical protein INR69_13630 [Mucilaginibacter polytrichastri]|nr:hypothetical protein [Mucilaginibacter polytrichastri]